MCYRHSYLRVSDFEHMTAFLSRSSVADVMRITNNAHCFSLVNNLMQRGFRGRKENHELIDSNGAT